MGDTNSEYVAMAAMKCDVIGVVLAISALERNLIKHSGVEQLVIPGNFFIYRGFRECAQENSGFLIGHYFL